MPLDYATPDMHATHATHAIHATHATHAMHTDVCIVGCMAYIHCQSHQYGLHSRLEGISNYWFGSQD